MKGFVKVIIAGCVIIGIGLAVLLIALGMNGWKFNPDWEMKTYTAQSDELDTLNLKFSAGELKTEFYDGETIQLEYPERSNFKTEISEKANVLTVVTGERQWYNFFTLIGGLPAATIRIPRNAVLNLNLEVNAGTMDIADGTYGNVKTELNAGKLTLGKISCDKLDCTVNAGSMEITRVACNTVTTEVNAGSAYVCINGIKADYNITTSVSLGSCNISSQTGSDPTKKLTVNVNAGSAEVKFTS